MPDSATGMTISRAKMSMGSLCAVGGGVQPDIIGPPGFFQFRSPQPRLAGRWRLACGGGNQVHSRGIEPEGEHMAKSARETGLGIIGSGRIGTLRARHAALLVGVVLSLCASTFVPAWPQAP